MVVEVTYRASCWFLLVGQTDTSSEFYSERLARLLTAAEDQTMAPVTCADRRDSILKEIAVLDSVQCNFSLQNREINSNKGVHAALNI